MRTNGNVFQFAVDFKCATDGGLGNQRMLKDQSIIILSITSIASREVDRNAHLSSQRLEANMHQTSGAGFGRSFRVVWKNAVSESS